MSDHSVIIWDASIYGQPNTYEGAYNLAITLREQAEQPSENFKRFYQQLQSHALQQEDDLWTERYSRIFDANEEDNWANNTAAREINLPSLGWEPVLHFIVTTANSLGLAIYNEDLVMAFIPPDRVLPSERAHIWQDLIIFLGNSKGFPKSAKSFRAWIEPIVDEMMYKHGFTYKTIKENSYNKIKSPKYARKINDITQNIIIEYCGSFPDFFIGLTFNIEHEKTLEIYNKFEYSKLFNRILNIDLLRNLMRISGSSKRFIHSHESAMKILKAYESIVFPILDKSTDILGLDAIMNKEDSLVKSTLQGGFYCPHCLIVARLANNSDFEKLSVSLREGFAGANEDAVKGDEWLKLVSYLRERA